MAEEAETESWDAHTHDVLSDFLCEMELLDKETVESESAGPSYAITSNSDVRSSSPKTQRPSPRMQIQELLQQIERLQSEVDGLRVNQLLGDSLDQFLHPRQCRPQWRLIATHEKQAATQANTENVRLKKRLRVNQQLVNRARKLMRIQIAVMQARSCLPLSMQPLPTESEADDTRIYNMMRFRMDRRCRQMDQLFAQCIPTESMAEFSTVISHADGVGVDFKESHIQPLDVRSTTDAVAKTMDLDTVGRSFNDDRLFGKKSAIQLDADGASRRVKSWFLMRRMELKNRSVLLWESCAHWSNAAASSPYSGDPIEVHASSWALVEPIPELGKNGSFLQVAVSLRVAQPAAGGLTSHVHPEISSILHLHEQFFNRRCRLVANRLTDMALIAE